MIQSWQSANICESSRRQTDLFLSKENLITAVPVEIAGRVIKKQCITIEVK